MAIEASPLQRRFALASLFAGVFLPPLDYFIVNLALPAIHVGLKASEAQIQFTVSAYALAYAVMLITGGRLGDLYGRRRVFMIGMAAFVVASALCGVATSGAQLVAGRVLQGISAALITPQVLASIRTVFPIQMQARLMGIYGFVFGLASVVGQIGGGALIDLHPWGLDWRVVFLVNVPIGLLALGGAWRFLPENRAEHRARIDVPGVVTLTIALIMLIYPLTAGRELHWPVWMLWSLGLSVPAFVMFIGLERRIELRSGGPLVDVSVLGRPVVAIGLLLAFLFYCIASFFLTYGIFLQEGLGWTPLRSGLGLAPYGAGYLLGPLATPWLARRIGDGLLPLGFGCLASGFALCAMQLGHGVPGSGFYFGLLIAGTGQGMALPTLQRIVLTNVDAGRAGMIAGAIVAMLYVGAAFATACIGGAFFAVLGNGSDAAAYAQAMRVGLCWMLVPLVAGFLLSIWMTRRRERATVVVRSS
ncbi:MFS transporter [Pandoraea horticolens]|uniref:MFS transporter n=1 Tax=Pandoraea horticolens TaxID=2508298 RepID=A0A5E4YPY6_9BURK|nr:MFS transporter [Pandoraea horticolens]VVE50320.1 MFS transporter [Pandoraea horticolens]